MLVDVAVRRIAWDQHTPARLAGRLKGAVLAYTSVARGREGGGQTVDALRGVREKPKAEQATPERPAPDTTPKPSFRFEAAEDAPAGDLTQAVGGATDKPVGPAVGKATTPKGLGAEKPGEGGMGNLLEAKRRAREQMEKKQRGEG